MSTNTRIITGAVILIIIAIVFAVARTETPSPAASPVAVLYNCSQGKTIQAAYEEGTAQPAPQPGEPPKASGSVALTLSDGRAMTLARTLSADGTRYANADESFVFWSKGNGALVLEHNQEKSYIGCIAVAPVPTGYDLPQIYSNSGEGFSLRLPEGYTPDASYGYDLLPGERIAGVKFTIPQTLAAGTNLSDDSYISVESIPQSESCSAGLFFDGMHPVSTVEENGTSYSLATSSNAGAGNRYEETVYALPGTNPCLAVRYLVHYGVIQNYPEGAVREFDKDALLRELDAIRHTLTVVQ
jgi:membrane-bound inhibitor of C-type lysozyme